MIDYLNQGKELLESGQIKEAIALLQQATTNTPISPWAYCYLGMALTKDRQLEEAVSAYEQSISIDNTIVWNYQNLGEILVKLNRLDEAVRKFRKVIELKPDLSWAYHHLGETLYKLGNYDEAINCLEKAIKLNRDFDWSYYYLGEALIAGEKWDKATVVFRKFIEINPDHLSAYYQLGQCEEKLGEWGKAIDCYRQASQLNPDHDKIQQSLAEVLEKQSTLDLQNSIEAYHQAIQLNPDNEELHQDLGKLLLNQGYLEKAINQWRKLILLNNNLVNQSFLNQLPILRQTFIKPQQLERYLRLGKLIQTNDNSWSLVAETGNQGIVSFGPYMQIPDGLYRIKIDFEFLQKFSLLAVNSSKLGFRFDIVIQNNQPVFYENQVYIEQNKCEFLIELLDASALEIRFFSEGTGFIINLIEIACLYQPEQSKDPDIYYWELANYWQQTKNYDKAILAYLKALQLNPLYLQQVNSILKELLTNQSRSINCYKLGKLLIEYGQIEESLYCYQQAMQKFSNESIDYSDLVTLLVKHGAFEQLQIYYQEYFVDTDLLSKANQHLAIAMAKCGQIHSAMNLFHKSTQKKLTENQIYATIWTQLNQLNSGYHNQDIPTELNPLSTYEYFNQNSQYKIINLWSLNEEDRSYLKSNNLFLANLEIIAEDEVELEEIYINSFVDQTDIKLSRKADKRLRKNNSIYNLNKGRYFQQTIIETGYIYTVCPITGKVLRSNHSFPLITPHPGGAGSWHPIHIYRFVGAEVFYLVCAVMPIGDKSFIYFPDRELIVTFVPSSNCYVSEPQIINMLKSSLVSYWGSVSKYISSSQSKEIVADLGWCYNLGHYIWNEMSGLQYLSDNGTLLKVSKFLIGHYEYINCGDTFPEIADRIIRWENPSDSWNLFKTIVDNNYVTVWPTDFIIQTELCNRIYHGSLKRCSASVLIEIEEAKSHYPLIWIAFRARHRVWLSQVEGIANIINKLYDNYPNLAVIFDGWGRHERHDPSIELEMQKEKAIVDEITVRLSPKIKNYQIIGRLNYERVAWVKAIDFYISAYGSGLAFTIWIGNKPGIVHGVVNPLIVEKGEWSPFIREHSIAPICLSKDYSESIDPGYANYDIDWQKIYRSLISFMQK